MSRQPLTSALRDKPQNGIAGLKHWRQDMTAGLLVSLVSLPLSMGIALASGAPPVCGLISAIIAGAIYPFLGGSYVTISGPAAGLAPAVLAAMITLGTVWQQTRHAATGDPTQDGYRLLLAVICITGICQIVISLCKGARLSAMFPASVVEGMLCAIGILIIGKTLPRFVGVETKIHSHEFYEYLIETWEDLAAWNLNTSCFAIGLICLAFMFLLSAFKAPRLRMVPPPLLCVALGIFLGWLFGLPANTETAVHYIEVPRTLLGGIRFPDFQGVASEPALWLPIVQIVVTLALIDGVESLATANAIDKIDPWQRKSDPDRTLLAMGVCNILSSLCGGLTIIPGGVKSKACIIAGGRTLWANFYNALFLVLYLSLAYPLINRIPISALAAVLVFTGWKMCEPKVWKHVAHIGPEQLAVFAITTITTLATDLLWGIAAGTVSEFVLHCSFTWPARRNIADRDVPLGKGVVGTVRQTVELFRNPVLSRETHDDAYHLYFGRPLVCFNALHVNTELARIPENARTVYLHITEGVSLIDHTTCDKLISFAMEYKQSGRGEVELVGLEQLFQRSDHQASVRVNSLRQVPRRHRDAAANGHDPTGGDGGPTSEADESLDAGRSASRRGSASVDGDERIPVNLQHLREDV